MPYSTARPVAVLFLALVAATSSGGISAASDKTVRPIDFNRDIRPILSNACFACHGPDANKRKGLKTPLRLDTEQGAFADLGGHFALIRGNPDESEAIRRISSGDANEVMPPARSGKKLTPKEVEILTEWVKQGAVYAKHWAYVKPVRPPLPDVRDVKWPRNPIDRFLLARLEREGWNPSQEADKTTLIRRLSLDLTGLPPGLDEVDQFINDPRPDAYEKLVDRLLAKPAYGEYWARMWLDLARYADSAGYADDPARTIWPYRDYVVRSLNANKPFDQFTVEQLAGDLLPNATDDQLIATAFHRNTLTNNEGGTNDEEFRSVAVVDRVNTTMSVWMGTTIACAQCHDHKYDPLSQEEYFRLYAFFNNTEDADRGDESPILPLYSDEQKRQKAEWVAEVAKLETTLRTPTPELLAAQERWERSLANDLFVTALKPTVLTARSGAKLALKDDQSILAESRDKTDVYTVESPLPSPRLTALRLEALPHDSLPNKGPGYAAGNFVVSRVKATIRPPSNSRKSGQYVRIELPGKGKYLSLAEVQVFNEAENIAPKGTARQSGTAYDGPAQKAIDGNTDGRYESAKSTTHSDGGDDPWWEVDLKAEQPIDKIAIWNRTDNNLQGRLSDFRVIILNARREPVWTQTVAIAPNPSVELSPIGEREIPFKSALADYSQTGFEAANVLDGKDTASRGWAIGGGTGASHSLTLIPAMAVEKIEPGSTLKVTIEQIYKMEKHTLGRFRLTMSDDDRAGESARSPASILAILRTTPEKRSDAQKAELTRYYLESIAPELKVPRDRLAALKTQLSGLRPSTTLPVLRELTSAARRKTKIQHRGNFMDLGAEVTEGVPAAFPPLPSDAPANRLTLARWLVSGDNPVTPRVIANRYWDALFGIGLVPTSEDFGSQGELPTHPELLDWLATEIVANRWDLKAFLKLIVSSAAYRQRSAITPEMSVRDPENRLVARGPRFRLPAETIRDQALFVSGLLSPKMYGPPVKPPQPSSGLSAAFGGGIDWETSKGEDRYRRGLYTTWRRSNPYPSMTTFDAPNREVCLVRRSRTNTPLQALVTLNDPVYVESAQALSRRMVSGGKSPAEKARLGFRLCLARQASEEEVSRLVALFETSFAEFSKDRAKALKLATEPIGPAPKDADVAELAAWTVVGNVLLNLDEMLMKR
ncbi:MAG: type protein [Planctomycetota bacterium]|nr:type protein [Planctomycetota bacterium]